MIDDSESTDAAVPVARHLAERFDARMLLVWIPGGAGAKTEPPELELWNEEHRIAAGDPAEAVAMIAAEEAADLIVIGARRGLLGRVLRSPLALRLAATVSCPVLVALPEPTEAFAGPANAARWAPIV